MGITAKQLRATPGERSGDTLPPRCLDAPPAACGERGTRSRLGVGGVPAPAESCQQVCFLTDCGVGDLGHDGGIQSRGCRATGGESVPAQLLSLSIVHELFPFPCAQFAHTADFGPSTVRMFRRLAAGAVKPRVRRDCGGDGRAG